MPHVKHGDQEPLRQLYAWPIVVDHDEHVVHNQVLVQSPSLAGSRCGPNVFVTLRQMITTDASLMEESEVSPCVQTEWTAAGLGEPPCFELGDGRLDHALYYSMR